MELNESRASAEQQNPGSGWAQDPHPHPHQHQHHQNQEIHTVKDQGGMDLEMPLMRQSSIYSLTLDEIQNTVCQPGKTFGSMNMDEFLSNIWSAEEGAEPSATAGVGHPPPLYRQGSLTVPAPLWGKTVDQVWGEIHGEQPQLELQRSHDKGQGNACKASRQPTFGEMTLEDFLVKAGVVREGNPPPPHQHNFGSGSSDQHQKFEVCFGGGASTSRMGGNNGYTQQQLGLSPVSPMSVSADDVGNSGALELEADGAASCSWRKRAAPDGGPEKVVVERRQRRMIKNRESAARSRARKQAYTVELEAELNQLREENTRLREEERRVKQMFVDTMDERARANAAKNGGTHRRCNSCPW